MIPWIRILLYFSIFTFIIVRLKKKESSLSTLEVATAFALKVLMGCLYGYIHLRFYNGDDTWQYNQEGLGESLKLTTTPLRYITDFWPESIQSFQTFKDYISQSLEHDIMIKLLGIFTFFSGGNYYVNVIFFNFILFWGHYWLFRFLYNKYPDKRQVLLISIFFIPPFVFWLSGIRGDGLVFFFLTLLYILFDKWLSKKQGRYLFYCLLSMVGIFIFRSAILLVLLPFLAGWFIAARLGIKPITGYLVTYAVCLAIFFGSSFIHPSVNLPMIVVNKQIAFMELPGKTRFNMEPLEPRLGSFVRAIPASLENTFLRPYLWESNGALQLVTALETTAFLVFILILLPFVQWKRVQQDPWLLGTLFFSISIFVFIGLTIPFPGAIIRYKVIPELLLAVSLLVAVRHIKINMIRKNS